MLKFKIIKPDQTKTEIISQGYNFKEFSNKLGVSASYLSSILNGKRHPSPTLAKKISQELQKDINEIFYLK